MKFIKKLVRNWIIDTRINELILHELGASITGEIGRMEATSRAIKRMEKLKY